MFFNPPMMRELHKSRLSWVCLVILGLSACTTTKLFDGAATPPNDFANYVLSVPTEPTLRPGDKITVSIWGHDDLSIGSINQPYVSHEETGRWIALDHGGEVNLPRVGRVKLGGYNIKEAALHLEKLYASHIVDPIINVRILNHFVTVLGEVNNPGKYSIQNAPLRVVELVGQAGGFTDYAAVETAQLMRTIEGKAYSFPINFTSFRDFQNKNAYIKADDVLYIPPKEKKTKDDSLSKGVGVASILTSIALIVSFFIK